MKQNRSYEDLEVWQLGLDLSEVIFNMTARFPSEHKFGLASQLQRSAVSVSSNIAEGSARDSAKDFLRFFAIASGSLAEVKTQLLIAKRVSLLSDSDFEKSINLVNQIGRMLAGLRRSIRHSSNQQPVTGNL